MDAGMKGPFKDKEYEKLLNDLGRITREKAFARKLKLEGAKEVSVFDIKSFMKENP